MHKNLDALSKKAGLPPGTLVHVGSPRSSVAKLKYIEFSKESFKEIDTEDWDDIPSEAAPGCVRWINVDGLHSLELIHEIGEKFSLHQLLQEDIVNTFHRPKFEEFTDHVFLNLKMLGLSPKGDKVLSEHISLVLGPDWILSFQERQGDLFDPFRTRLRENTGTARSRKADYVFYRLIDLIVDNYFHVSEHINEEVEKLEEEVMTNPDRNARVLIQDLKKRIAGFRKSVQPLREALNHVMKSDHHTLHEINMPFFRDVGDHLIHLVDTIDNQRDMVSGILDLYLSGISFKMNQVMQVLTIIATIFIPLTFLAGIYGMNFENMPELSWRYGYYGLLALMAGVFVVMIIYFKRKKWL